MWLLTKNMSFEVKGFNMSENELWVTKYDGKGYLVASGEEAIKLYKELSDLISKTETCLIEGSNEWIKICNK